MQQKENKNCQILKFQNENETKNKNVSMYIHSILMFISNIKIYHAHW